MTEWRMAVRSSDGTWEWWETIYESGDDVMSNEFDWSLHLMAQSHMHLFEETNWRTNTQCEWCGETWWDWATESRKSICNCGENDLPKPEREVVL